MFENRTASTAVPLPAISRRKHEVFQAVSNSILGLEAAKTAAPVPEPETDTAVKVAVVLVIVLMVIGCMIIRSLNDRAAAASPAPAPAAAVAATRPAAPPEVTALAERIKSLMAEGSGLSAEMNGLIDRGNDLIDSSPCATGAVTVSDTLFDQESGLLADLRLIPVRWRDLNSRTQSALNNPLMPQVRLYYPDVITLMEKVVADCGQVTARGRAMQERLNACTDKMEAMIASQRS
jgi:hypothetical protein